jgi:uncharacterized protein with von Willebrand factor type A (vWA) domain
MAGGTDTTMMSNRTGTGDPADPAPEAVGVPAAIQTERSTLLTPNTEDALSHGALGRATLPETMEFIGRLSGRTSEATGAALTAWARELYNRFLQLTDQLRQANADLREARISLDREREKRIIAEQALKAVNHYRTLREVGQAGGVGLVLLALEHIA